MEAFLKTGKLGSGGSSAKPSSSTSASDTNKRGANQPWVEKYRPRSVEDVAHQDEVVAMLKKCVQGFDLPNLLFYGPPGTGKTSTILAVCRDIFGPDFRQRVLELNASDERGISVIRVKVKNFSQLAVPATRSDGKSCPPLKMIILDEVDSMTSAAQAALRRTMEKETKTTRFCLICNYVSRIIDPLTSRCAKFRFKPLADEILTSRLQLICEAEKVQCDTDTLSSLVTTSGGDLRKAITTLQSAVRLCPLGDFNADIIDQVTGIVPSGDIDDLVKCCEQGVYDRVDAAVDNFILNGHGASQVLQQLFERVVSTDSLSDVEKSRVLEQLGSCECRLLDGADEYLQLLDASCHLMAAFKAT